MWRIAHLVVVLVACGSPSDGETDDTGTAPTWDVQVELTADDFYDAYVDGSCVASEALDGVAIRGVYDLELGPGDHVLGVATRDEGGIVSGLLAVVRVDGQVAHVSGTAPMRVTQDAPDGTAWIEPGFDDSAWGVAASCSDTTVWGSEPASMLADGAQWVWVGSDCSVYGDGWFRLAFTLP